MKASVLEDDCFKKNILHFLDQPLCEDRADACQWVKFKAGVKEGALSFGVATTARKKAQIAGLLDTLQLFMRETEASAGDFLDEITKTKKQILGLLEEAYWGALVRCREQKLTHENSPSKVFRTFERERGNSLTITNLTVAGGELSQPTAIAAALGLYYADLIQEQPAAKDIPAEIPNLVPKILEEVRKELGGPITAGVVERAIATLSTGKVPGADGIGNRF